VTVTPGTPPTIKRDQFGNALGGIRLPHMDAPVGKHPGTGCGLAAGFAPFDGQTLQKLYPSHKTYVDAVTEAANRAVKAGFLLPADAKAVITEAEASKVGSGTANHQ
jgi:hypothetical protein